MNGEEGDRDRPGHDHPGGGGHPVAVRCTTVAAVLLVAAVAAIVSYAHMQEVARAAGEGWRAYLLPLSVDGLVVASSMVLLTHRRLGLAGGWLPWCALLGGVGASLAANIAAAEPSATARIVAAWPAVAFAVAFELLLEQRRHLAGDQPDPTPSETDNPATAGELPPAPAPAPAPAPTAPLAPPGPAVSAVGLGDPVGERDELAARVRALLAAAPGRPPGRRALARELGVTEHQARTVLDQMSATGPAASNGAAATNGEGKL